jgi:hypothetical protein
LNGRTPKARSSRSRASGISGSLLVDIAPSSSRSRPASCSSESSAAIDG